MSFRFPKLALPLLAKELVERAARKGTYQMRVAFAALLMVCFGILANEYFSASGNSLSILGHGRSIFEGLIVFQIIGIYLFLPAIMAGQITYEKERDSLALLFLTRLGPWQIVLEKYFSALVPIFSLLLVAMPMAAIAYAYGGITTAYLALNIYILVLVSLQVGALALMCSAWCRATSTAFLATYLLGTLIYLFIPICDTLFSAITGHPLPATLRKMMLWVSYVFPPAINIRPSPLSGVKLLISSIPAWVSILLFLGLARFFLIRRAFVKAANPLLAFFQWLDRLMHRLNPFSRSTRSGKENDLPTSQPIAWREMRRNVLARPRYLIRILLMLEIPSVMLGLLFVSENSRNATLSISIALLGILGVLVISVNAANTFVSERVQQTLDLLLTTPISARRIVQEKARAMRPLLWVVATPLMTLFLIECSKKSGSIFDPQSWNHRHSISLYLVCSVLTLAIYLPLVSWLSLWIGLKAKTRFRAIITALIAIVVWCVAPIIVALMLNVREDESWIMVASPLFVPAMSEFSELPSVSRSSAWQFLFFNFAIYGVILCLIRVRCLSKADHYLRRA